ncbi:hypothetical protein GX50_07257 [[Emmonsia] crescens]|uniref:Uncharacterized protein n=1 Tax=[Emmonsia] crescens TaxID=73230 RepID=A0A2B7Z0V1_9EURO|nr:hypothetical protein GX50_07257 [Emmonsia crescens]
MRHQSLKVSKAFKEKLHKAMLLVLAAIASTIVGLPISCPESDLTETTDYLKASMRDFDMLLSMAFGNYDTPIGNGEMSLARRRVLTPGIVTFPSRQRLKQAYAAF